MFRKQSLLFLFFIFLAGGFTLFIFSNPSEDQKANYQKLMLISDGRKEKMNEEDEKKTHQRRVGVSKQILYTQNRQRLQTRIRSKESYLAYRKKGNECDLIEEFDGLTGEIQEKKEMGIEGNEQLIQSLEAVNGIYSYHKALLEASEVALSRHIIKNREWPEEIGKNDPLLFRGRAKKVDLSLLKGPTLKFYDLKASLFDRGEEAKK